LNTLISFALVSFKTNILRNYAFQERILPEFRDILDFGAMLSSTVFFQPRFMCRKKNMLPMIAAAYFVEQRSFHCLSAHNFGFYNSDKQREGEADLSLPLICHTAQAVAARWKQPDPCTRLAAEIPSCNKVGLGVREISIAGREAGIVAL